MLNYALSGRKSITQTSKNPGRFVQQQDIPECFCWICLKATFSLPKAKVAISCRIAWENLPQTWPAEQKD